MSIDFTGITLPFSATDLLNSSVGLLGVFGSFILLGLAVTFTPKLISLIRSSAKTSNSKA